MSVTWHGLLDSIDATKAGLQGAGYIASRQISTAVYLAQHLQKPILVEGPAGVGKTELAQVRGGAGSACTLIRMQCYEGLDESKALYEWKYGKQLLYTQILKDRIGDVLGRRADLAAAMDRLHGVGDLFFSEQFLEPRPLLRALQQPGGAVLLIDEIDKADQEFEAFLLEVLSDYQVTIPEIGTIKADDPADRDPDLQQHARPGRCAEAPLPAPAHRPAGCASWRRGSSPPACRASRRSLRRAAGGLRAAAAHAGPEEAALGQRDRSTGPASWCCCMRRSWTPPWCATR